MKFLTWIGISLFVIEFVLAVSEEEIVEYAKANGKVEIKNTAIAKIAATKNTVVVNVIIVIFFLFISIKKIKRTIYVSMVRLFENNLQIFNC